MKWGAASRGVSNSDKMSQPPKTPANEKERAEIESMLHHFGGVDAAEKLYRILDSQLAVVHTRAQSLVQLVGVVITVTGFSGRIIADTNDTAQMLIITGLSLVLIAAMIALVFVMPIRWLTSYMDMDVEDWVLTALRRRRRKNIAYFIAIWVLIAGMILYVAAISIMLAHPEAAELNRVR